MLLRSGEAELQQQHWQAYQAVSEEVDRTARVLLPQMDGAAKSLLEEFLTGHARNVELYRAAHGRLASQGYAEIDNSVRGIDRPLAALLGAAIGKLSADSRAITEQAYVGGRRTFMLIAALMLLVSGATIAVGVMISRSRSEERRVGKECRSRCDWSSDVCSSDLGAGLCRRAPHVHADRGVDAAGVGRDHRRRRHDQPLQIGRASCRERV